MNNPPSKMSFEHWGEKITLKKPTSDITMEEFHGMCRALAKAVGYHDDHIKEYFDE
jgi:hypothetical protein